MAVMLGITGAIGSGKSAFANMLSQIEPQSAHYETSQLVSEIADVFNKALKAELAFETTTKDAELINQVLIWLPDAISERLHHEVVWNQLAIIKRDTLAHPELYEKLFAYLAQVRTQPHLLETRITAKNRDTYRPILQWIGGYLVAKVSKTIWYDELIRRAQERDADKNLIIISGVRYPGDVAVIRTKENSFIIEVQRPGHTQTHHDVTEAERSAIRPDITVVNNGTLQQLEQCAEIMWNDIASGKSKPHYGARA